MSVPGRGLPLEVDPESCRWAIQRICFCRIMIFFTALPIGKNPATNGF